MPQNIDTDLKALASLGIDINAKEAFGVETEVEDQGLESEASEASESLQMSAMNLIGAEGETEIETWDITSQGATGVGGALSSAFKQATKVLKPVGIALDFLAVERVGPPVLEFEMWGQTDIFFSDDAMNIPYGGLP